MREIINIQCGQCGCQMGADFWELATDEHGLDLSGGDVDKDPLRLQRANVFFSETAGTKYVPRAVMVDLDPASIDNIRSGPMGKLFAPDSFVAGKCGAGGIWARGYYTSGAAILDQVIDVVRKQIEGCDCLQGFVMTHALGGGTGSGLGGLIQSTLRETYCERMMTDFVVFPSMQGHRDSLLEPYNTVLSFHRLVENSDMVYMLDNDALSRICFSTLKKPAPTFSDMNKLVAMSMSGVTCSLRFPGQLNTDLRKMAVNLVPFPRLHFLTMSLAPLVPAGEKPETSVKALMGQMFEWNNVMCSANLAFGQYLTACAMFRGPVSAKEVDEEMAKLRKTDKRFTDWVENGTLSGMCAVPPKGVAAAATLAVNSTGTEAYLRPMYETYVTTYRRKANLQYYFEAGMEESEFWAAESTIDELITDLQWYATCHCGEDEEDSCPPGDTA